MALIFFVILQFVLAYFIVSLKVCPCLKYGEGGNNESENIEKRKTRQKPNVEVHFERCFGWTCNSTCGHFALCVCFAFYQHFGQNYCSSKSSYQGCEHLFWSVCWHEKAQRNGTFKRTFDWVFVHDFCFLGVLNFGRDFLF